MANGAGPVQEAGVDEDHLQSIRGDQGQHLRVVHKSEAIRANTLESSPQIRGDQGQHA